MRKSEREPEGEKKKSQREKERRRIRRGKWNLEYEQMLLNLQ
jgi:hypothetical protein